MGCDTSTTLTGDTEFYAPVKKVHKGQDRSRSPYTSNSDQSDSPLDLTDAKPDEASLQRLLGYAFHDPSLLRKALTHKSLGDDVCNQKLEWLGDSVLQLAVSDELYHRFGDRSDISEGDLTVARISFVRGDMLRSMSAKWNLGRWLKTAKGVSQVFIDKMQEDMVEALLGAVMLDGGYEAAKACVVSMYQPSDWGDSMCAALDHKSTLQNLIASLQTGGVPIYEVIGSSGPDNNKSFTIQVSFEQFSATGSGTSKLKAEQAAAKCLIDLLQSQGAQPMSQNSKSELLELCHKRRLQLPIYSTSAQIGKLHSSMCSKKDGCSCEIRSHFQSDCQVSYKDQTLKTTGQSMNKKGAEKVASSLMIKTLINLIRAGEGEPAEVGPFEQEFPSAKAHPKSFLMELSSKQQHCPPRFEIVEEILPKFLVKCSYPDLDIERIAEAPSKKLAEKLVADMVLQDVLKCVAI